MDGWITEEASLRRTRWDGEFDLATFLAQGSAEE